MLKDKMYDEYDSFAFFYNRYWTITTPALMKKVLDKLLIPDLDKGSKVLDLCCGTGNLASIIKEEGYDVCGVDGSSAMLAYAETNAKGVRFIRDDARSFTLDVKFDAATCLFDSINHILDKKELLQLFKNIYKHLNPNAKFIFDINSLKSSVTVSESAFSIVTDNDAFICNPSWDEKAEQIKYNLTMFIKDNSDWIRNDHTIVEKYYATEDIIALLSKAGFKNLSIFDGGKDLKIKQFKDRIFFTAWR